MSTRKPRAKPGEDVEDDSFDELTSSIVGIVEQLRDVQARARELGVFANDRALLACSACGLMEDVLVSGLLITSREDAPGVDTGLRFAESRDGNFRFTCPTCGAEAAPDDEEPQRS